MDNIKYIKNQIKLKQKSSPHFATIDDTRMCVTDNDHFPYTRYFRGVYNKSTPVVYEREAGWRPVQNNCYKPQCSIADTSHPHVCFQTSCSKVHPCRKYKEDEDNVEEDGKNNK